MGGFAEESDRSSALAGRQAVVDLGLGPGVQVVETLTWAAERHGSGWRMSLGDPPAKATRRIVARVMVTAGTDAMFEAARAQVRGIDRAETEQLATATARAEATVNPQGMASRPTCTAMR